MPDYASILRRSIAALPEPGPEMREAVYQRARAALARQLTAVDPPLSTREIELQHQELEDAVARLEAEYVPAETSEPLDDVFSKDEFLYSAPQSPPAQMKQVPVSAPPLRHETQAAPSQDFDADDDEDEFEDEAAGGRLPLLIGVVLVLLVIVGLGAYAFAERDSLLALIGFGGGADVSVEGPSSLPAESDQPDPEKAPDRLVNGTTVVPPEAPPPETALVQPDQPPILEQPPAEEIVTPPAEEQTAALPDPGTSLVEQRAIYYYQGAEGSAGTASEGNVTWSEITKDGRPAIQAALVIADQNVSLTVTIYKNFDEQLPASHLVEIQFAGALGGPIQRVPALVLKQTEQARGEPLAGAAVQVTPELYWIALSDDAEQVERNIQLLRDGSWFDIPILFNDQTRALISFEKGIPGDRVFETVMSTWTPA